MKNWSPTFRIGHQHLYLCQQRIAYQLRNYGADWSWCFFGRELVAYSNITSDEFFDEISKNFSKSIRGKIRENLGFTPMPEMDEHVANYPVSGKTGCPVIISKYSEEEKIKDRIEISGHSGLLSGYFWVSGSLLGH